MIAELRRRAAARATARSQRQLRRLLHEASTSTHRADLLVVADQAKWWR